MSRFSTPSVYLVDAMGHTKQINNGTPWRPTLCLLAPKPEPIPVRDVILGVLAPFPEARAAVAEALKRMPHQDGPEDILSGTTP